MIGANRYDHDVLIFFFIESCFVETDKTSRSYSTIKYIIQLLHEVFFYTLSIKPQNSIICFVY